jgi:hypothetical protein
VNATVVMAWARSADAAVLSNTRAAPAQAPVTPGVGERALELRRQRHRRRHERRVERTA